MKKLLACLSSFALFAALAVACGGSTSETCKSVNTLCADKGTPTCSADAIDKASNASEVKTCLDKSPGDCTAATACLALVK